MRCGWDVKIKEQQRIKDSRIQSGAVLWLRHSFARAFSGDSMLVDCFASLAMTQNSTYKISIVIASERGNQQAKNPDTVACHETSAFHNDKRQRRIRHSTRLLAMLALAMTHPCPSTKEGNGGWIQPHAFTDSTAHNMPAPQRAKNPLGRVCDA